MMLALAGNFPVSMIEALSQWLRVRIERRL